MFCGLGFRAEVWRSRAVRGLELKNQLREFSLAPGFGETQLKFRSAS